ncbi:hypothetical protein HPB52_002812 [Rhipicephalus sanguineus]|uniref:Uncharacterized protein n=1 Tax=Rhipicephalus sanguineus TaxID=34632 RepID=A0A9D4Q8U8_RHISA|nr:hypothetical protein HPB52_002812 [Rhipicephalus sanguineus]
MCFQLAHQYLLDTILPTGAPARFEHLPGGALGRVKYYVHWAESWQCIAPMCAKLRRLPLALRQQDASELRRRQDDDVIVDGRGRRLHSTLHISNQVLLAQAISGVPADQWDSAPAEAQSKLPAAQDRHLGPREKSSSFFLPAGKCARCN